MADNQGPGSLQHLLAEVLPRDVAFTFYHYSTPPTRSTPIFNAAPHRKPERTYCESHFLGVSVAPPNPPAAGAADELIVLAIEVLIFSTKSLTTIFVSKADSTGYLAELSLPRGQAASPLKAICGTFVAWLARERQREGRKLVVSLFARAQDQYLFPASIENPNKHVLDDRGLVKWWCKVLDPLVREYAVEGQRKQLGERLEESKTGAMASGLPLTRTETTAKGYLVIPGFDPYDTLRYTPPPTSPGEPRRWAAAHPLLQIAPQPGAPPRCLVPHFPDDPKSRFLDELDEELPDARTDDMSQAGGTPSRSNGQWKSVKTLDQFWETMAFRQECSSGRIVGFIWVVITPPQDCIREEDEETEPSQSQPQSFSQSFNETTSSQRKAEVSPKTPRRRKVNTTSGPIPFILPRIKSSASNLSAASNGSSGTSKLPPESSPYYKWPSTSRGTLLLSATAYNRAHEILIHQSFANRNVTAKSTKRWKDEVGILGGMDNWTWTVVGKKESSGPAPNGTTATPVPVTVMGVRKKRKPEAGAEAANALGDGLVRKKVKSEGPAASTAAGTTDGVNMLGAGLVRKKQR